VNDPSEAPLAKPLSAFASTTEAALAEAKILTKVRVGFAFAILLTCLLSFFSWRMAQQASNEADWVAHTHEVSTVLEATLRHLVDVETGGRGFALTGHASFLEPYETGKSAIGQDLHRLRLLVADNTVQTQRLDILEAEANARIAASTDIVTSRQNTGALPSPSQFERGKPLMDAVRATIAEMEDEEKRLLAQRTGRVRAAQHFNLSLIGLGALAGVIFLFVAGTTVSREIGISARAGARVISLNADLERRVEERTVALGESEGRVAGIIQSAMDSIITVDEEQRIVLFNSAAERVFLCPAAEALGQSITRFIPQRFHGAHADHVRRFGKTGVTNRAMGPKSVLWAVRADGQEFPIEASISQVVTGAKRLFTVILRDVTERTQAEAMRERLAAIVESSDDAIISKTLDGTITAWNRGAEKVFGYPSSEVVGKKMWMIIPTERAHEEIDILARISRGESVQHFETIRMRKDGKAIDVSVTISPIRGADGEVVGASKIARDITERKRAQEALRQSDTRREFALKTAGVGDWDLDLATLEATRSSLHDQIFGYSSPLKEWSFDIFLRHVHPDDRERVRERFQTNVSQAKKSEFECRVVWPNGEIRWIWACGDQIRDYSGKATRMFGIVQDITERKRAEEALRDSEQRFQALANGIPQLAWMAEADGHIFWYNQRWYDYTGTTFEQMEGWAWETVHDPACFPRYWKSGRVLSPRENPSIWNFLCGARTGSSTCSLPA
jgi:PAS domain S-box-containing protein